MSHKRIVVAGAGYAGLGCAYHLQKKVSFENAEVYLIDRNSYHQNCTALHEVAMGNSAPEEIIYDLKGVIDTKKVHLIQAEIEDIDMDARVVKTSKGDYPYDILVNALGFVSETFGIQGMDENAFHISNIVNSESIVSHLQSMFKRYAKAKPEDKNPADVTVVVGGAGLTGIELLGELVDSLPLWCRRYGIDRREVKVYCVEAMDKILPMFDDNSVKYARDFLEKNGISFMLSTPVVGCSKEAFQIKKGEEVVELKASTRIWTAGVRGNRLMDKTFPEEAKRGRVVVGKDLRAPSRPEVYLIGDVAAFIGEGEDRPYPPTGQIATQMGTHAAKNIVQQLEGKPTVPFVFKNYGCICSLGNRNAIAILGKGQKLKGLAAIKLKRASETKANMQISGVKNALKNSRVLK